MHLLRKLRRRPDLNRESFRKGSLDGFRDLRNTRLCDVGIKKNAAIRAYCIKFFLPLLPCFTAAAGTFAYESIEPGSQAFSCSQTVWEARIIPLDHSRMPEE